MELRVPQPALCNAIQRRSLDEAAECARRAEPFIVCQNEQNVGRTLGWYDARRPPRRRLRRFLLDHPAELRIGRRKLFSVDCGGGVGRTRYAVDLLSGYGRSRQRKHANYYRNVAMNRRSY